MSRLAILISLLLASLPARAQRVTQGEDESAALVDEGRRELKRGKLDDAAKALDQAIALNPRRVDAYVLRAAVYAARKQYKQGVELMRRAQAMAPTDDEVLVALGTQLVLAGDADVGVPLLEQVTAHDPRRYDAQLLLGGHYHDTGNWPAAVTALEAYFAARPAELAKEDARHRVDLADAYLRSGKPQQALGLFQRAAADKKTDLRARIGVAWATAAIDCKKARPLLRDLEPAAEAHPEVWLVDGQCALALGDPGGALALGRRYLDKAPHGSAAGHALVGEAYAARGNLAEAKKELAAARELEPARRRWTVRFAVVLRRAGDLDGALAALDKLGPPAQAALDPDWWAELGETLLAKGDAAGAASRLAPPAQELPEAVALHVVLGAAQLASKQPEAAVATLAGTEGTPRGRKLLVDALVTGAAEKLADNAAVDAEPLLVRAEKLDANAMVERDLGIARLAQNRAADAIVPLDRAAKADGSAITLMLAARARALAGDVLAARPLYERAVAAGAPIEKPEVAIDWAASELAGGDPNVAVTALEKTATAAGGAAAAGKLAARHKAALATARHAAGVAALRAGNGARAVELLRASAGADPQLATRCDLALAAVVAGEPAAALSALAAVGGQSCPFPAPADTQAAPILVAFVEAQTPKRAARSLDRLTALAAKATGAAAALLGTATRVVALEAGADAYKSGDAAAARKYLATAKAANARIGGDEVAANLALLDLIEGKTDSAIVQLERIGPKVPEALVTLGIAYDKKGEPQKALDAWKRARKAGARFGPLNDWIDAKERVYGSGGEGQ
jgi:tetratricopeptide (TPR) repeat protein